MLQNPRNFDSYKLGKFKHACKKRLCQKISTKEPAERERLLGIFGISHIDQILHPPQHGITRRRSGPDESKRPLKRCR